MQKVKLIGGAIIALTMSCTSGKISSNQQSKPESKMEQEQTKTGLPSADKFVKSPLRTSLKLELNAPASEVWAMVGNPERMPEYSAGLRKVDAQHDGSGNCTGYICHFFPAEKGGQETVHTEIMKWYEPNRGLASVAEEPNVFGLQQSLGLITLETQGSKTILKWDIHFNAENGDAIKMNIAVFEQSLNTDIAQNLIKKFGGKVLESYIEGKK